MSYLSGDCPKHGAYETLGFSPCPICLSSESTARLLSPYIEGSPAFRRHLSRDVVPWHVRQHCTKHGAYFRGERERDTCPECVRELRAWKRENIGRRDPNKRYVYVRGLWRSDHRCPEHGWHPENQGCLACHERVLAKRARKTEKLVAWKDAVADVGLMRAALGLELGWQVRLGKNEEGKPETVKVPDRIVRGIEMYYAVKETWERLTEQHGPRPTRFLVNPRTARAIYDALVFYGYPPLDDKTLALLDTGDYDWSLLAEHGGEIYQLKLACSRNQPEDEVGVLTVTAKVRHSGPDERPIPPGPVAPEVEREQAIARHAQEIERSYGKGAADRFREYLNGMRPG